MIAQDDELDPFTARAVTRAALLAGGVFAACAVWFVRAAPEPSSRPAPAPMAAPPVVAQPAEAPAPVKATVLTGAPRTVQVTPPRRVAAMRALRLGFFRDHDGLVMDTIALDEVLRGTPAVKVVNLWAWWCEPCKRENQKFLALSKGWRREVRFVPVHVGAIDDLAKYRTLVDEMPPAAASPLIDASSDAIQSLLRADELLAVGEGIPITLVLDCRNDLRWLHAGELVDESALDAEISRLRAELGSARCAAEPSRPPGCGDAVCALPEDCSSCPEDCGCTTPGTVCRTAPGREGPHCAFPDSAFNEGP